MNYDLKINRISDAGSAEIWRLSEIKEKVIDLYYDIVRIVEWYYEPYIYFQ